MCAPPECPAGNLVGNGEPGPVTNKLLQAIRTIMADSKYGLSIHADEKALKAYLQEPCLYDRVEG